MYIQQSVKFDYSWQPFLNDVFCIWYSVFNIFSIRSNLNIRSKWIILQPQAYPLVHPSSIEVFEHHEGIKALQETISEDFPPLVTVQTIETSDPAPGEIKSLPPVHRPATPFHHPVQPVHHVHHRLPAPHAPVHTTIISPPPVISSLRPVAQGPLVPFVHHLHSPTSDIPKLIFSPLHNHPSPKPLLVEIGHQSLVSPAPLVFSPSHPDHNNPTPRPFLVQPGPAISKLRQVPKSSGVISQPSSSLGPQVQTLQGSVETNSIFMCIIFDLCHFPIWDMHLLGKRVKIDQGSIKGPQSP